MVKPGLTSFWRSKRTILHLMSLVVILAACQEQESGPVVVQAFPTADTLPENLLRMYVQFSEPMKTVGSLEKIKLIDQDGQMVSGAIFNNVYELWDAEQKQLTLIFDPARVKTGLITNERLGRALQSGKFYQLVIDSLESVQHRPLATSFRKGFYVCDQDTVPPDIQSWQLIPPTLGNPSTLIVRFPQMVDYMSLWHRLAVVTAAGEPLPGKTKVIKGEQEWQFKVARRWEPGNYFLYVNTRLADPAGNNLNGKFDHQIGTLKFDQEGEILKIPFQVMN